MSQVFAMFSTFDIGPKTSNQYACLQRMRDGNW